jgi:hypothetical protein
MTLWAIGQRGDFAVDAIKLGQSPSPRSHPLETVVAEALFMTRGELQLEF